MKICAIICELNPLHNGHRHLFDAVRASGKFDGVLCIMSGHFTQRGDRAVCDKFTRAKHAVLVGADGVIELPAPFAVAPAPVFAEGAVKIVASVPGVCALAFGCEQELDFKTIAKAALGEDGQFREILKDNLAAGESYAKSYSAALKKACGAQICEPNNILALEYAKAILKYRPGLEILPVKRQGSGYNEVELGGTYASASAIREHMDDERIRDYVPPFVYTDLSADDGSGKKWQGILKYALATAASEELAAVYGGGEGVANKLKTLERLPLDEIIQKSVSKRYPAGRIKRALTDNALGFTAAQTNGLLEGAGYIKPLAVRASVADELLKELSLSPFPLIITGSDINKLSGDNLELYNLSRRADDIWCAAADRDIYDYTILKI